MFNRVKGAICRAWDEALYRDEVEVVRCKNCAHVDFDKHDPFTTYECKHPKGLKRIDSDSYCCYGEAEADAKADASLDYEE